MPIGVRTLRRFTGCRESNRVLRSVNYTVRAAIPVQLVRVFSVDPEGSHQILSVVAGPGQPLPNAGSAPGAEIDTPAIQRPKCAGSWQPH